MARRLNGTNQQLQFLGGSAINEVHTWGMAAAMFKRTSTGSTWHCPIYSGNGGASSWGLSLDINTGNTIWFGIGTGQAEGSTAMNATDRWYIVVVRKASGTVAPLSSIWNSSTGTWSHQSLTAFANGAGSPTVSQVRLGSFGGFDFFAGDIAAGMICHGYAPSNVALEALGLEDAASNWVTAAGNATLGAGLWIPGDTAVGTAIQDLTGNGANESSFNVGTVVSDLTDWYDLGAPPDVELEATIACQSGFTQALRVERLLTVGITGVSSLTLPLEVSRLLDADADGQSGFTSDIEVSKTMFSDVVGQSDFSANLQLEHRLSADIVGASGFDASIAVQIPLDTDIVGQSDFTADLLVEPAPSNELETNIAGSTTFSFELQVIKELFASIEASSDFQASMPLVNHLIASIEAESGFHGNLQIIKELASSVTGASSLSAALQVAKTMDTSVEVTSDFTADIQVIAALVTDMISTSSFSSALQVEKLLAMSVVTSSGFTASLSLGDATAAPSDGWFYDFIIWARRRWFQPQTIG